jgi:ribosomal protein S20
MRRRSVFITAALGAGLMLGLVLGPTAWRSTASAQTQPPARNQATSQPGALQSLFLDKLAAALNIQRSALDTAIKNAGTSTADTAVQQGTLTQAQADQLKARIQSGDLGALWGGRGGPRDGIGAQLPDLRQAMLDAAAKTLNITSDELTTQLRSGQTIAQLAQAHNTTEQAVTNAALAAAKAQLDQAVKAGTVTQAQADAIYTRLQQDGSRILGHAGHGPDGRGQPQQTPANPQTPATPQAPATGSGL